mmetsp:Transcript_52016/g.167377  ORF Transcript_52016/g.167377 Transcript_52016/m.167377 type:complete len:251 (+) Transcript_52016:131-883(+)
MSQVTSGALAGLAVGAGGGLAFALVEPAGSARRRLEEHVAACPGGIIVLHLARAPREQGHAALPQAGDRVFAGLATLLRLLVGVCPPSEPVDVHLRVLQVCELHLLGTVNVLHEGLAVTASIVHLRCILLANVLEDEGLEHHQCALCLRSHQPIMHPLRPQDSLASPLPLVHGPMALCRSVVLQLARMEEIHPRYFWYLAEMSLSVRYRFNVMIMFASCAVAIDRRVMEEVIDETTDADARKAKSKVSTA